jgi:hypothetical protein
MYHSALWTTVKDLARVMQTFQRIDREDRARAAAQPVPAADVKKMN